MRGCCPDSSLSSGLEVFIQKKINEPEHLFVGGLFDGTIEPDDKLLEGAHIVSNGSL